jgi:LacI family transcriptional regulator
MAEPAPSSPSASRAGIVQIAERLGVSPSTVSRALRPGTAHLVKEDRRKKILALAESLRFTPNPGARMIRKGVNTSLAVVVPHDENIFFSEYYGRFLSGVLHAAAARSWDVRISTHRRVAGRSFRESLLHLALDSSGLIYLAEPLTPEELASLRGYRRPIVLTKSALPASVDAAGLGLPVVGVDNEAGARAAAALLLQLGHRQIALVLGPEGSRDAAERRQGYLAVLAKAGATPPPEWIVSGNFSLETGREAATRLLGRPSRPTAVCCASDEIAFGVIDAARAAGISCPEQLSVVGFDDGPWATVSRPRLTTVRQPLADLAERAVGLIVEAASNPGIMPRSMHTAVAAALVMRESTVSLRPAR